MVLLRGCCTDRRLPDAESQLASLIFARYLSNNSWPVALLLLPKALTSSCLTYAPVAIVSITENRLAEYRTPGELRPTTRHVGRSSAQIIGTVWPRKADRLSGLPLRSSRGCAEPSSNSRATPLRSPNTQRQHHDAAQVSGVQCAAGTCARRLDFLLHRTMDDSDRTRRLGCAHSERGTF